MNFLSDRSLLEARIAQSVEHSSCVQEDPSSNPEVGRDFFGEILCITMREKVNF